MEEGMDKITDSVSQVNLKVLAESPAFAMATSYQSMAHSLGLSMENIVAMQQQIFSLNVAALAKTLNSFTGIPAAAAADADDLAQFQEQAARSIDQLKRALDELKEHLP